MQRKAIILGFGLCLISVQAHAESVCKIIQFGSSDVAIVAQPGKLSEFISLIRAGEKSEAVKVVACAPSVGDKVIVTNRGFGSHTIRVLSGTFQGCVGDIVTESVGQCQ